jgi:hypothetical protein
MNSPTIRRVATRLTLMTGCAVGTVLPISAVAASAATPATTAVTQQASSGYYHHIAAFDSYNDCTVVLTWATNAGYPGYCDGNAHLYLWY